MEHIAEKILAEIEQIDNEIGGYLHSFEREEFAMRFGEELARREELVEELVLNHGFERDEMVLV